MLVALVGVLEVSVLEVLVEVSDGDVEAVEAGDVEDVLSAFLHCSLDTPGRTHLQPHTPRQPVLG